MTSIPFPNTPNDFYQTSYGPPPDATNPHAASNPTNASLPNPGPAPAASNYYIPPTSGPPGATTSFDEEPPLLEELGINVAAVLAKIRLVANPFSRIDTSFADDADMTGPLVLCLLLGLLLLLQRKLQFSVIYSQATVGCLAVYLVFNLMASHSGIDFYRSTSILGYALLPIVLLSFFAIFLPIQSIRLLAISLGAVSIFWASTTATKIFVAVLRMDDQFWLVWYPLALLYTSFALITVF